MSSNKNCRIITNLLVILKTGIRVKLTFCNFCFYTVQELHGIESFLILREVKFGSLLVFTIVCCLISANLKLEVSNQFDITSFFPPTTNYRKSILFWGVFGSSPRTRLSVEKPGIVKKNVI